MELSVCKITKFSGNSIVFRQKEQKTYHKPCKIQIECHFMALYEFFRLILCHHQVRYLAFRTICRTTIAQMQSIYTSINWDSSQRSQY